MSAIAELPDDLAEMVRLALRDEVCGAEPSPAVWERIRERVVAGDEVARGRSRTRRGATVQMVAILVALLGLGAGASLYQRPMSAPRDPLMSTRVGVRQQLLAGEPGEDHLSGRILWRASRASPPASSGLRRGLIE